MKSSRTQSSPQPPPPQPTPRTLPELLAPAGDWACAKAAVENGADAIYFGLGRFNARLRAENFTTADLPALMEFLHGRGLRGYVTFNTLVFANEIAEAEPQLRAVIAAGVDAALVQDIGICRLIRALSPDFPIHASTQMTVTSAAGVEFVRALGCGRVVLARECSLQDIAQIQTAQAAMPSGLETPAPLPLEVFVHGALCVAYSGQCLTSESLGGRSANRGECAQACRMPYELICDRQPVPLGDRRYLLSPQDLAGLERLPELLRAGVSALKIEGRLKTPEYVANITRIYRQALDRLAGANQTEQDARLAPSKPDSGRVRYELEMAFSRGLHTGWLDGINNQQLVHGRFGRKRGVYLGEVTRVQAAGVSVKLQGPLKPGDGIVFDAGQPDQPEEGGRVYALERRGDETVLSFGQGDIDFRRVQVGNRLWKTSDPDLERRVRATFAGDRPRFTRPVAFEVHGHVGAPLHVILRDEAGRAVEATSNNSLTEAKSQPLTTERLREQLGRLGGTPFRLGTLENRLDGSLILPLSELNRLRRDLVTQLGALRAQPRRWTLCPPASAPGPDSPGATVSTPPPGMDGADFAPQVLDPSPGRDRGPARPPAQPELIVLVRSLAQLEAVLECGLSTLYCELEDPKQYCEAVQRVRRRAAPPAILVAPPRITKPREEWILRQVRACEPDGYLVRNYDHLTAFAGARCVGDFSLNVANQWAAAYLRERFALERITASYDLNSIQLEALLQSAPAAWFEITIHQHMPMFHMEHCIFCAFLSTGTDFTNCGRPCDRHQVRLRDRVGAEHPVKADAGCRNTVFNALPQSGAEYVARFISLGARFFRVEFVDETPAQVQRITRMYRRLLDGQISGGQLWRELKVWHRLGVTRGAQDRQERAQAAL